MNNKNKDILNNIIKLKELNNFEKLSFLYLVEIHIDKIKNAGVEKVKRKFPEKVAPLRHH